MSPERPDEPERTEVHQAVPPADPAQTDDPDQLREQIGQTREELGETVEALSDKADVKGQVSDKVDEQKERASQAADQARQRVSEASPEDVKQFAASARAQVESNPVPAAAGAFVAGLVLGRLTKRR